MRKKLTLGLGLFALALALAACSHTDNLIAFSGRVQATPNAHQVTYREFVGTYKYAVWLQAGTYQFSFTGESGLSFELRGLRGKVIAKFQPGNQVELTVAKGEHKLVVINDAAGKEGSFDIAWVKL